MPDRLVVSFRAAASPKAAAPAEESGSASKYLTRALSLKKRAEALGATLCAWSAQTEPKRSNSSAGRRYRVIGERIGKVRGVCPAGLGSEMRIVNKNEREETRSAPPRQCSA